MKKKSYAKRHHKKISLKSYINTYLILTIVFLVITLIGFAGFIPIYTQIDVSINFLYIGLGIGGVGIVGFTIFAILFSRNVFSAFYKELYSVSKQNYEGFVKHKTNLKKYTATNIQEFSELNELIEQNNKNYQAVILTSNKFSYDEIDLKYVNKENNVLEYDSFIEHLSDLIDVAKSFRNAIISFTYDLGIQELHEKEKENFISMAKKYFNYIGMLIVDNTNKFNEFLVYVPNFDSLSRLKQDINGLLKNTSLIDLSGDETNIIQAHCSVVVYPYSDVDELISDLRYANRQGQVLNFYLPNKNQDENTKILTTSMNLNNIARYLEKFSKIDVSNNYLSRSKDQLGRVIGNICRYLYLDNGGIITYNNIEDRYEAHYIYTKDANPTIKDGTTFDKEFVELIDSLKDDDGTYFFSNRSHVDSQLGRYLDRFNITSGFFYVVKNNNKPVGVVYYYKHGELVLDSYLRESLLVFSHFASGVVKDIADRIEVEEANDTFKDLLKISGYHMYEVEKNALKLQFLSDSLRDVYPKARVGQYCYKAFFNSDEQCPNCPLKTGMKIPVSINDVEYESTLNIANPRSKSARILLMPKGAIADTRNRFDKDLLINSYYSFANQLQDLFSTNGKGYVLFLKIVNNDEIFDKYGNEGYFTYLRCFCSSIKERFGGNASIYKYNNDVLAILLRETGKNELIDMCEKIYEISKSNIMNDDFENKLIVTYFGAPYPVNFDHAYDFIKNINARFQKMMFTDYKDRILLPENKYERPASREEFVRDVIVESFGVKKNFIVNYQPYLAFKSLRVQGGELLIRLNDMYRNLVINAGEIVKVADQFDKVPLISNALLEYIGKLYQEYGMTLFKRYGVHRISMNADYSYFKDESYLKVIGEIRVKYTIPKQFIIFEISENELASHYEQFKDVARKILRNDMLLCVDNYTGSELSIEQIKALGFEGVKVAKSLVSSMKDNQSAYRQVEQILSTCRLHEITVTLVGIETDEEVNLLKELLDYDFYVQGYHYYKPLEIKDISQVISTANK